MPKRKEIRNSTAEFLIFEKQPAHSRVFRNELHQLAQDARDLSHERNALFLFC